MSVVLLTPPAEEPLTLAEAKAFLRITHSHEDTGLTAHIKASRAACERYVRGSFITQTWKCFIVPPVYVQCNRYEPFDPDDVYGDGYDLPRGPIVSLDDLQLVAKGSNATTSFVAGTHYWVTAQGRLRLDREKCDETFRTILPEDIVVEYTAGMSKADLEAKYPDIKEAVKIGVHNLFDGRGFNSMNLPPQARELLAPYRKMIANEV